MEEGIFSEIVDALSGTGLNTILVGSVLLILLIIVVVTWTWNRGLKDLLEWIFSRSKKEEFLEQMQAIATQAHKDTIELLGRELDPIQQRIVALGNSAMEMQLTIEKYKLSKETIEKTFSEHLTTEAKLIHLKLVDKYYNLFKDYLSNVDQYDQDPNTMDTIRKLVNTKYDLMVEDEYSLHRISSDIKPLLRESDSLALEDMVPSYHTLRMEFTKSAGNNLRESYLSEMIEKHRVEHREKFVRQYDALLKAKLEF